MAAGAYLYARNPAPSAVATAGLVATVVGLSLCASRLPRIGFAAPSGRDHLRPGERRRLKWRAIVAITAAAAVLMWPMVALQVPFPAPVAAAHALAVGVLLMVATRAWIRIVRDPARRGCTAGRYGDCPDCDALAPLMALDTFLAKVADDATDTWLTDPGTGTQMRIDPCRHLFLERRVTGHGHQQERAYLLASTPGKSIQLTGLTVWDEGPVATPDFDSAQVRNALSIDGSGIAELHERLKRATAGSFAR